MYDSNMKRPRNGSTLKQSAYAQRILNGGAETKKEAALLSGFSQSVANNAGSHIEKTQGFHNAMIVLAHESNNMMLEIFSEYKARGLKEFSDKDLNSALNAISNAWERIEKRRAPNKNETPEGNPLKRVVMNRIENQTIINNPTASFKASKDDPNDF